MSVLLVGKLKLVSSMSVAALSAMTVPTTLAVTISKDPGKFVEPITSGTEKAMTWAQSTFDMDKLKEEYENFGTKTATNIVESPTKTAEALTNIKGTTKTYLDMANSNRDEINYYTFLAGDVVKSAIRHAPIIARDSIIEATGAEGSEDLQLLSVQKAMAIANNEKIIPFLKALEKVSKSHPNKFNEMTYADADGILQIIREQQKDPSSISTFLEGVKKNTDSLGQEKDYCNAAKLILHVFVGKEKVDKINETVNQLKEQLDTLQSTLKDIMSEIQVDMTNFKAQLEQLAATQTIKDPCASNNAET